LSALRAARRRPEAVVGPRERAPFRRLASARAPAVLSVVMVAWILERLRGGEHSAKGDTRAEDGTSE
jgi:hypothetical protein